MNKQIKISYPAAISYLAKDEQPVQQQNLQQIKSELKKKSIQYSILQVPVKFVEAASSSMQSSPQEIAVISFTDYKKMSKQAGFHFAEKPVTGKESLQCGLAPLLPLKREREII